MGKSVSSKSSQQGSALFISLIALVSMLLAGIALMRSTDTANVIAGNFAFKESSLHAADAGIDLAFVALPAFAATGNVPVANVYYTTMLPIDGKGVPVGIDWSRVPTAAIGNTGNVVQYIIERMCQGTITDPVNGPTPTDTAKLIRYCIAPPMQAAQGGSKAAGHSEFAGSGVVYYRVTVRVTGVRNSVSMVQAMLSL